jgi:hypothetical protein
MSDASAAAAAVQAALSTAIDFMQWTWTNDDAVNSPLEVRIGYSDGSIYELYCGSEMEWLSGVWRTPEGVPLPFLVRGCYCQGNEYPRSVAWHSEEQFEQWGLPDLLCEAHGLVVDFIGMTPTEWHMPYPEVSCYVWKRGTTLPTLSREEMRSYSSAMKRLTTSKTRHVCPMGQPENK